MLPVSLYGADDTEVDNFFSVLPGLVEDAYDDRPYQETLFAITGNDAIRHITISDSWDHQTPFDWPEDLLMD